MIDQTPCYIAKCNCGGLVFASVDEPNQSADRRKDNAREVAKMIAAGYVIERMPVEQVRQAEFCKCKNSRTPTEATKQDEQRELEL
jgi:hypothetical protein